MVLSGSGSARGALVALVASGALLAGAYGLQLIDGLVPCELCMMQRYAHGVVVVAAVLALALPRRLTPYLFGLGVLALVVGAGIAVFHVGVEQTWWDGPSACSAGTGSGTSVDDLLKSIEAAPVIRCGDVQWTFLGLSMAVWNAVLSLGAAVLALAVRRTGR